MVVSREPETGTAAFSGVPAPRTDAAELLKEVSDAVAEGHEGTAARLLADNLTRPGLARSIGMRAVNALTPALLSWTGSALDSTPSAVSAAVWSVLGAVRLNEGEPEAALRACTTAYELDPSPALLIELAVATRAARGTGAAFEVLRDGLERWPDDLEIRAHAALAALDDDEADLAETLSRSVLDADEDQPEALTVQARLLLVAEEYDQAVAVARRIVTAKPSTGRAVIAIAFSNTGRLDDDPGLVEAVLADPPQDVWLLVEFSRLLFDDDRFEHALSLLDKAFELAPDDPEVWVGRGSTKLCLGDYDGADADFARLAGMPEYTGLATAFRGEVAGSRGDLSEALRLFGEVPQEEAPDWMWRSLGQVEAGLGHHQEAISAYEHALAIDPVDVSAMLEFSDVLLELDLPRAEQLVRQAIAFAPDHAPGHARLGEVLRRRDRFAESLAAFDRALELAPEYSWALASRAQSLVALGRVGEGVDHLRQAVLLSPATQWIVDELVVTLEQHDPEHADEVLKQLQREVLESGGDGLALFAGRAGLAQRRRRFPEADRLYARARRLSPEDTSLIYNHVTVLQELGRTDDAIALLDERPDLLGLDESLRLLRVGVLWRVDRLDEVREELLQLTAQGTPDPSTLAALADVYRTDGDRRKARELIDQVLRDEPDNASGLASLGACEIQDDEIEPAREHLRRAVELDPSYPFAWWQLLALEADNGTEAEVESLLARIAAVEPQDQDLYVIRAYGQYLLGDYRGAVRTAEECLAELGGQDPLVLSWRGWSQLAAGHKQRAVRSFLQASVAPRAPKDNFDAVQGLLAADGWDEAVGVVARAVRDEDPFAGPMCALIWAHAGAWEAASSHALLALPLLERDPDRLHVVPRSLRLGGHTGTALSVIQEACRLWPANTDLAVQLGEALFAEHRVAEAKAVYARTAERLGRKVHLGPDGLSLLGWCLLRTDRYHEAGELFLRALSTAPIAAPILGNLIVLSVQENDPHQAGALLNRARDEFSRISPATRRGVISALIYDLGTLTLDDEGQDHAARIADSLRRDQAVLDDVLDRTSRSVPLSPHQE
ncbi:tetratricopeptide repeat protein [Lentzea sp. NPDC004789]